MLEIVWTSPAEIHVQRLFAENENRRVGSGTEFVEGLSGELDRIREFPESSPVWFPPFRRLVFHRKLGVFHVLHGRRIVINGLFPLSMAPQAILRRLQQTEWP